MKEPMATILYILDPGVGLDVVTFTTLGAAVKAYADAAQPRLYSHTRGQWREFRWGPDQTQGSWSHTMRDNLSVKVLDAAKVGA